MISPQSQVPETDIEALIAEAQATASIHEARADSIANNDDNLTAGGRAAKKIQAANYRKESALIRQLAAALSSLRSERDAEYLHLENVLSHVALLAEQGHHITMRIERPITAQKIIAFIEKDWASRGEAASSWLD